VVEIRPAEQRDVEAFSVLMKDLDRCHGPTDTEPPGQRVRQIAENLVENLAAAYVLLASENGKPVGMAAYSFLWPAVSVTRSLYLKELYVTKEFRCKGIGALLMQRLCQVAVEHECGRVEWAADQGNPLAEAFYERLGVPKNPEKIFYRLENDSLQRMAAPHPL
jgi:GNAT superfamily N-acetyltransferase